MGLELVDGPLPLSSPFAIMAQSEAASHRKSHKKEEKLICASTDLCLAQRCQSGVWSPLSEDRRGWAVRSFCLARFSPKFSFSLSLRYVRGSPLSSSAFKCTGKLSWGVEQTSETHIRTTVISTEDESNANDHQISASQSPTERQDNTGR